MSALQVIRREFDGSLAEVMVSPDGDPLMTSDQVGLALGYSEEHASVSVNKLYSRHVDELAGLRFQVKVVKDGVTKEVTCWKREGIVALAFFARTGRAKAFRIWLRQFLSDFDAGRWVSVEEVQKRDALIAQQARMLVAYASASASHLASHGHLKRRFPELFGLPTDQRLLDFVEVEMLDEPGAAPA